MNRKNGWESTFFKEQPYLANVYPGDRKGEIGIIFCIDQAEGLGYFNAWCESNFSGDIYSGEC